MRPDVLDLRKFYDSRLGLLTARFLGRSIREVWPSVRGESILGIGYTLPYLSYFMLEAERLVALMPASQGVHAWPEHKKSRVFLADDANIPLPDMCLDRVLLVHALEVTDHTQSLLREVWRTMTPNGRLLVVTPNRRGIWARVDHTPFGYGQPFSANQLTALLRQSFFVPRIVSTALFFPPTPESQILRFSGSLEHLGHWLKFHMFAGVLLVEAKKEIYAPISQVQPEGVAARRLISTH